MGLIFTMLIEVAVLGLSVWLLFRTTSMAVGAHGEEAYLTT